MGSLHVIPGEFSTFTIAIAILSGFIVIFGCVSMFVKEKCFLSEAFVALIVGIIAGPLVANGFDPQSWENTDEVTKELTRCILAIQVMAVGIELPKHYLKKEWLTMLMLLLPTMIFMWLVSGLFIWWLIPPLNYLHALVIAACVCPTDPILANSVVKGRFAEKHVPAHIRNALSAESGANDGMGFPFLFLALFLLSEDSVGTAIGKWIYITCLFQITLSCVIGLVVGYVARKILQWSERHHLIDKPSFLCFAIALALFLMSLTGFSGSDDLLACFVAGNAFSWDDWFRQETEEAHFQDVIDMMLNLAVFVYIGSIIPWASFGDAALGLTPWRLVVIAILILLFRRLPILIVLKPIMPAMKTYREAIFSGWFGPMGVGAVFLSIIAKEQMTEIFKDSAEQPISIALIEPVVLFIVLSSTLVHGTTIPLFKIGNRIRTRTLSMASTSSGQVLRLPKLGRKTEEERSTSHIQYRPENEDAMSQLKRNTLMNTIQHERPQHRQDEEQSYSTPVNGTESREDDDEDDDDLNIEDFLPHDDSDETEAGEAGEGDYNNLDQPKQHPHIPATATTESQNIRFLEPVKPRTGSSNTSSIPTSNVERNETSVSSFKSWKRNNKDHRASQQEDADLPAEHNIIPLSVPPPTNEAHYGGGGVAALKNLFRRHQKEPVLDEEAQAPPPTTTNIESPKEEKSQQQSSEEPQPADLSTVDTIRNMLGPILGTSEYQESEMLDIGIKKLSDRIEVWDEPNHVVLEDQRDADSRSVIDKSEEGWQHKVKDKVHELQANIDKENKENIPNESDE